MLERILRHINNWFQTAVYAGTYEVINGGIELPDLKEGQYFRVTGSVLNDGVYRYPTFDMLPEVFTGTVWALAVPKDVITLAAEIDAWEKKHGTTTTSPYKSESFAGYSYTKDTDSVSGGAVTWETAFRKQLNRWRKI